MKRVLSFVVFFAIVGFAMVSKAQLPTVGAEYYIENVSQAIATNGIERRGLLITCVDDSDTLKIKPWNITGSKEKQIWKFDGEGYLVNKGTGKKALLSGATNNGYYLGSAESGTKFAAELLSSLYPNNPNYANLIVLTPDGETANKVSCVAGVSFAVSQQGKPGPEVDEPNANGNGTGSPRAWRFVPVAEYEARNYPKLNDWYYIVFPNDGNKVLSYKDGDTFEVVEKAGTTDDNQLWKVVAATVAAPGKLLTPDKVQIINKATGKYIERSIDPAELKISSTTEPECALNIKTVDPDQFAIGWCLLYTNNTDFRNGYYLNNTESAIDRNAVMPGSTGIVKFEKAAGGSNIKTTKAGEVEVYVKDGYVRVEGTNAPVSIYSITGTQYNSTEQLATGAYIVKVAGNAYKVIVK